MDRPLLAYALLATISPGDGDLLSKVAPLLRPLIKKENPGTLFDPAKFAAAISSFYGIEVHPWAAEELAPRLEKAKLLTRVQLSTDAHEYRYAAVFEEIPQLQEEEIRRVVQNFIDYSTPILKANDLPIDNKALEEGFFDQLVKMDFVSILIKPDRSREDEKGPNTISIQKSPDQKEWEQQISAKSKIDVLCASFILHLYRTDRTQYDLLVNITGSALLLEVILNVQDPQTGVSLKDTTFILDGPFVMSVLDLSSKDLFEYATRLSQKIEEHEGILAIFRHSVDEIRENLRAVLNRHKTGQARGHTANRMHDRTFLDYATTMVEVLETRIEQRGIKIIEPPGATAYRFLTADDEEALKKGFGIYENPIAQMRDAASAAGVVRLRRGKLVHFSKFHLAEFLFITENPWIPLKVHKILVAKKLQRIDELPPCITDRYLAGMLLILYGGKALELTRYRLLANCSSAVEARFDVVSKTHRYLNSLDPNKAEHFRALMTNERASQHLMTVTLGDSALITEDKVEKILEQMKSTLTEELEREKKEEIARLEAQHREQLQEELRNAQELRDKLLDAEGTKLQYSAQAKQAAGTINSLIGEREAAIQAQRDGERKILDRCVKIAGKKGRQLERQIPIFAGLITVLVALVPNVWDGPLPFVAQLMLASIGGVLVAVGFWKAPDWLFGRLSRWIRIGEFRRQLRELNIEHLSSEYIVNWNSETATRRDSI